MIWLGVAIALAATVANAFSMVLQAQEARESPGHEAARLRLLWQLAQRPRWLIGTMLLLIAWPLQIVALLFAPLTVVQPVLASFQLILLFVTRFWRKHRVRAREWAGGLTVTLGVVLVIIAAPRREITHPPGWRVTIPVVIVGVAALLAYLCGRARGRGLIVAVGAGLGYAWADFLDKLVSNALSAGRLVTGLAWLAGVMISGVLAFLLENTALQRRSPVLVAPVIGAIQEPLPVIMALVSGIEIWEGDPARLATLAAGLLITGLGATVIARSEAVAASHDGGDPLSASARDGA